MSKLKEWLKKDNVKNVMMVIDITIMGILIFLYLLNMDLNTAPDFIYNQF